MSELNREQIINEIQSLIKALKDCGGWVKRGNCEGWFNHEILADALALIEELTEENERFRYEQRKLIEARDTFREYAFNVQKYVEHIKHHEEEGYSPSAAKSAAEMEMWRVVALEKRRLVEENERLKKYLDDHFPKCIYQYDGDVQEYCVLGPCGQFKTVAEFQKQIEADTVRKMRERLTLFFANDDTVKYIEVDAVYINEQIEKIAKEMVEG